MSSFKFAWPLIFLLLSACASQQVKKEELAKVRTIAIVGFDVLQQKSVSGGDLLGLALGGKGAGAATTKLSVESAHLSPVLEDLHSQLGRGQSWRVLPLSQVKASKQYQNLYRDKTEGFQNRPSVPDRYDPYRAPGFLDSWAIQTSSPEQLRALAQELRVDALVVASATVHLNNSSLFSSLVGKGEYKPKADLTMILIQVPSGDRIFTATVQGPESEAGEKNTLGMADDAKLNKLVQVATSRSIEKMMKEVPSTTR